MSKKKIVIIIAFIIIITIATGVFVVQKMKKLKIEQTQNQTQQSEQEQLQSKGGNKMDISNWKTYRNDELGFEFEYPEEFKLSSSDSIVRIKKDCSTLKNEDLTARMKCDLESDMSFGVTRKTIEKFIEDYKSDFSNGVPLTRISFQENYILNDVRGKILVGTTAEGAGGDDYIFVSKNGKNYLISLNRFSDINLKVIKTFKFLK